MSDLPHPQEPAESIAEDGDKLHRDAELGFVDTAVAVDEEARRDVL
jgi:hypothetical protein